MYNNIKISLRGGKKMKKLLLITSLIFSLVFLSSCADKKVVVKPSERE